MIDRYRRRDTGRRLQGLATLVGVAVALLLVAPATAVPIAMNDLLYQDGGTGQWWSSTYQSAGVGPASSIAGGPDVNLGYANDREIRLGNRNNDAAGRIDHFYQDGDDLWRIRTYDPAAPQPGPAFTALGGGESGTVILNSNATDIQLGDYNNNGQIDTLYRFSGDWWARTSQPSGTQPGPLGAEAIGDVNMGLASASEMKISDWNNDGDNDLLYFHPPSNTWYARTYSSGIPNDPGGTFLGDPAIPTVHGTRPFIMADYDNDGKDELIYFHAGTSWWAVEYSATVSGEPAGTVVVSDTYLVDALNIVVGDYNNDGQNDFIYKYAGDSNWYARTYDSSGATVGSEVNLGFAAADKLIIGNLNNSLAIPEPASIALLGIGVVMILGRRPYQRER